MTAQPVAMVSNAVKAPPAPIQGGHGLHSFVDYLGGAGADLGTANGLASTTALATSLRARKFHLKGAQAAQDDSSTAADPSDSPAAQISALSLSGSAANVQATADALSGGAGVGTLPVTGSAGRRAVILANSALDASNNAATPGGANTSSAANANSFLGLLAAGSSLTAASGQATDPASSPSGDAASPASSGAALPIALNEATPAITPAGTAPPHQPGPPATAFVVNQFGAPGASSVNDPGKNSSTSGPSSDKQANAATTTQTPPSNAASGSSAGANTLATLPGAAALNARIVAGAATLSNHPNQAAAAATTALTQPADPNAGALPPSASPADAKTHDNSGFGLGSGSSSSSGATATTSATGANTATDSRNFAAAVDRAAAQAQAAGSSDTSKSDPNSSGDTASAASATSLALPQTDANSGPAATSAPSNAGLHPALIAMPAAGQIAINLKQAIAAGENEIQIQLKPASLGTIDVKLNVNHDGRLTAVISADRSDTLNLLKQDSSSLQQSLRDAGFSADSGSLSFNLRSDTQSFAQNSTPQLPASLSTATTDLPTVSAVVRAQRQHAGTLDIQV